MTKFEGNWIQFEMLLKDFIVFENKYDSPKPSYCLTINDNLEQTIIFVSINTMDWRNCHICLT
jgi:hypothetical protein